MKKQSMKGLASDIVGRVIERWQQAAKATDPNRQFDVAYFKLKLTPWIDAVSNISDEAIQSAILTHTNLEVDGHSYLPTDLHIVKAYYANAIAASLVDAHDTKLSHHIPTDKMFTPSLFPKLDYEEARKRWIILGETQRVEVGDATNYQWRLHDNIKEANFTAQKEAHDVEVKIRKKREKLFKQNPDCSNTDSLMKKLGAWKT